MTLPAVVPAILCGGSGTRLWPLSRALYPKQLLAVTGEGRSLLQQTWQRIAPGLGDADLRPPLVVCNEAHRFLVERELREGGTEPLIVLEPAGRNTAPAAAVAALVAQAKHGADCLLLVLPSDHVIRDDGALRAALAAAVPAAMAGRLVTFGVVPTQPETGYGYIQASPADDDGPRPVLRFVEKPDRVTAERYIREGGFYWNSGMFLFSAGAFLAELERQAPDIVARCRGAVTAAADAAGAVRLGGDDFRACRAESIDYAVMEKTAAATIVPLDAGWSDVGSWAALHDLTPRDARGNAWAGDVTALDCDDTYVRAESRLVTAVGLRGCIVVETKDAVLVVPRDRAQDVKALVDRLGAAGRGEVRTGREVFRPWGSFDSLDSGTGFQVKRLTVLPGAVLSLQLHHRRAEHWVVVAGRGRITRGDDVFELGPDEHTFIPVGTVHRIENAGTEVLQVIEVQIGAYLGEDDIVRIEDRYGRQGRTD